MDMEHYGLDEICVYKNMINKLRTENNKLKDMIKHYKYDDLTGFLLRKDFEDRLEELWYEHKTQNSMFIYAMIDINDLHDVNRDYGYVYGDMYINNVTEQLRANFNSSMLFRIGGDEFCILKRGNGIDKFKSKLDTIKNIEYSVMGVTDKNDFKDIRTLSKKLDKIIINKKKSRKSKVYLNKLSKGTPYDC